MGGNGCFMAKTTLWVCIGKHCKEDGSKKTRNTLRDLVQAQGLEDAIEVDTCNCLGKCGKGPVIRIEPGGERVKRISGKKCEAFLEAAQTGTLGRFRKQ